MISWDLSKPLEEPKNPLSSLGTSLGTSWSPYGPFLRSLGPLEDPHNFLRPLKPLEDLQNLLRSLKFPWSLLGPWGPSPFRPWGPLGSWGFLSTPWVMMSLRTPWVSSPRTPEVPPDFLKSLRNLWFPLGPLEVPPVSALKVHQKIYGSYISSRSIMIN